MLALAAINWLRGRGGVPGGRFTVSCLAGLSAALYDLTLRDLQHAGIIFLIVALGFAFWAIFGWGKFDSSFTGRDDPNESEIPWIDRLGYKLFPVNGKAKTNRNRGALCMALRGMYFYPTFALLAFVTSPWSLLIGFGCLLQGSCWTAMRYAEEEDGYSGAAWLNGALFGALIATAIT